MALREVLPYERHRVRNRCQLGQDKVLKSPHSAGQEHFDRYLMGQVGNGRKHALTQCGEIIERGDVRQLNGDYGR